VLGQDSGNRGIFQNMPAAFGLVILGILWLAVRSRFDRVNPVAFYFTMWIVATALLVAWVRGAGGFAIESRYSSIPFCC
jgi:hypothetical protein